MQISGRKARPGHQQTAQSHPGPHGGWFPTWRHPDLQQSAMVSTREPRLHRPPWEKCSCANPGAAVTDLPWPRISALVLPWCWFHLDRNQAQALCWNDLSCSSVLLGLSRRTLLFLHLAMNLAHVCCFFSFPTSGWSLPMFSSGLVFINFT